MLIIAPPATAGGTDRFQVASTDFEAKLIEITLRFSGSPTLLRTTPEIRCVGVVVKLALANQFQVARFLAHHRHVCLELVN